MVFGKICKFLISTQDGALAQGESEALIYGEVHFRVISRRQRPSVAEIER
jgi:hypothetical protein